MLPSGLIWCKTKKIDSYIEERVKIKKKEDVREVRTKFISEALTLYYLNKFKVCVLLLPCGWTGHITS